LHLYLVFIDSRLQVLVPSLQVSSYRIEIPGIHFQDQNTEQ
jgi:hypothetical protein